MKRKILILQSVQDQITDRRELRMKESPSLQDFEIEHIYAIELTHEQRKLSTPAMMSDVCSRAPDEKKLFDRLAKQVATFKPEFLIVHAGFVFYEFPQQVLSSLKALKERFPELRIGIESHGNALLTESELRSVFDQGRTTSELIQKLF